MLTRDSSTGTFATVGASGDPGPRRAGETALLAMQHSLDTPFIQIVASLDDKEIANARPVALWLLGRIANVGAIVQEVFGGSGHGRDNVGKSLITMAENSEEQVLALLLTSSCLKDDRVRQALPDVPFSRAVPPAISFLDFVRLRYLALEVPDFAALLSPSGRQEAFASLGGAERWRARFDEYWMSHDVKLHDAMALRPDLFAEPPLETEEESEIEVDVKKKSKMRSWNGVCSCAFTNWRDVEGGAVDTPCLLGHAGMATSPGAVVPV